MHTKTNKAPALNPPGIHTAGELAFPMLATLTQANEAARAKRFRKLCAVHQRQREMEAGQPQQGGAVA
ncbi:MAG: hypothetical protein V4675_15015 [Verrucomicrobiota bacterium]